MFCHPCKSHYLSVYTLKVLIFFSLVDELTQGSYKSKYTKHPIQEPDINRSFTSDVRSK